MGITDSKKSDEQHVQDGHDEEQKVPARPAMLNADDMKLKEFEWTKDENVTQEIECEKWYGILSDFTMKSVVLDCTKEEICAIKDACDVHRQDVIDTAQSKYTQQVKQILESFARKIQRQIDANQWNEQGVFVRFTQRSPKDAVIKLDAKRFHQIVESNALDFYKLQKEQEHLDDMKWSEAQLTSNAIIRGMIDACSTTLCVKNGRDAVQMIIHSDRIFTDFCLGLLADDNFSTKCIIREFNHSIDFECEFRCFVFKGNLNAITQYNHFVYVRKLTAYKQRIQTAIHAFWKHKVHPNMSAHGIYSYVMDVALLKQDVVKHSNEDGDGLELEVVLIEINPFCTKAGALMFNWKLDVSVMTAVDAQPIDFRVLETPYDVKPPKFNTSLVELFDALYEKMSVSI